MFTSDLANMFTSDLASMFTSNLANMFTSDSANMFTSDLADMFTGASANMFTSASANMFTSDLANKFTSDLGNMFTSDLANMFTSELEKCKKMIWPTCSLVKLSGEYVGLVPEIRHLIHNKYSTNSIDVDFSCSHKTITNMLESKINRSCHRKCFIKKGDLKNFAKSIGKHLC